MSRSRTIACLGAVCLFALAACSDAAELIIEASYEKGIDPVADGPGTVQVDFHVKGIDNLYGLVLDPRFISKTGADATNFTIRYDAQNGNPDFGNYCVDIDVETFGQGALFIESWADSHTIGFTVDTPNSFTAKTLIMSLTFNYNSSAAGPYLVDLFRG